MTVSPERIEEALALLPHDLRLRGMGHEVDHDPRECRRCVAASALREEQDRAENAQSALQEQYDLTAEAIRRGEKLEAENERLREALEAISDRGDFEPFDDRCAPVLIAIARDALAVSPPADEAKHYCAKCERIVDGETALIHQTCGTWVESAADYVPPADETKR